MAEENPYKEFLLRYRNDPVAFVEHVLKVKPQPWQAEMLRAVCDGERKVSIRSGHGVGKSTAASWVMLWYSDHPIPRQDCCNGADIGAAIRRALR